MIFATLKTNLAIQALTFGTSVLLARALGPTGRGEFALILLYPQLLAGIAFMGVDRAVAVLGGRGQIARPVTAITKLVLLFSLPAMAAGYATVHWRVSDAHLAGLATLYLAYIPAMYFFLLVVSLFNGIGDFGRFNVARLSFYFFNFCLVFAVSIANPTPPTALDWMVLVNLTSVYAVFFVSVWMLRGLKDYRGMEPGKRDVRAVIGLALMFTAPVVLAQVSNSAYQIALERLLGISALGFFVVFFSYSRLISSVGSAAASHIFRLGIAGEPRDIVRIFRLTLVVYLICASMLWLFANWLIPLIFGAGFVVDGATVGLLCISCVFALLADSLAEYLNGKQKVTADIVGRVTYLLSLAVVSVCLVPIVGLAGMAIALVIGDLLRCAYLMRWVSQETGSSMHEFARVTWMDVSTLFEAWKRFFNGFLALR